MPSKLNYYEAYASFSRNLRTWLVAYGIGAPVLFASQDAIATKLALSSRTESLVRFYLAGVLIQVLASLGYKSVTWYLFRKERDGNTEKFPRRFAIATWLYGQHWLEVALDAASIGLYVVATYGIVSILTLPATPP